MNINTAEDILPNRLTIIVGTVLALAVAATQLIITAFSVQGFEVGPAQFVALAFFLLPPMYAAAYHLRKAARWLGLRQGLRRRIVVAEYDPPCPPAVAGALIDGEFDMAEVKGAMIDLAGRGYLDRTPTPTGEVWTPTTTDRTPLHSSQLALLENLFRYVDQLNLPEMRDRFREAASATHEAVLAEARASGLMRPPARTRGLLAAAHTVLLTAGYIFAFLMIVTLLGGFSEMVAGHHPNAVARHWELLFEILQVAILATIAGTAYLKSFLTVRGLDLSADIAGFYLFVHTVFENPARYLSLSDMTKYYPYAVAFRLPTKLPADAERHWDVLLDLA